MYVSEKGRLYRLDVLATMLSLQSLGLRPFGKFGKSRLKVEVKMFPPDRKRRDLDNVWKALLDAMQHAGLYDDDEQIDDLRIVRRGVVKHGKVEVDIEVIDDG